MTQKNEADGKAPRMPGSMTGWMVNGGEGSIFESVYLEKWREGRVRAWTGSSDRGLSK